MNDVTTTDFAQFGHRERHLAEQLLRKWREDGLPNEFEANYVRIMMNRMSGCVFLTNAEYQVAMMNGDTLEIFHTDPETGEEGFAEDLSVQSRRRLNLKLNTGRPHTIITQGYDVFYEDTGETITYFTQCLGDAYREAKHKARLTKRAVTINKCKEECYIEENGTPYETVDYNSYKHLRTITV